MAHFYGTIQGNRLPGTKMGTAASGFETVAASWKGCIKVRLYVDSEGRDCFEVRQAPWQGVGISELIACGVIGEAGEDQAWMLTPEAAKLKAKFNRKHTAKAV